MGYNKWIRYSLRKSASLYIGKNNNKRTYNLLGKAICKVDCIRDLGILIDSKLSFSQHYDKIIKHTYFTTHQVFRVIKTNYILL